MTGTKKMVSLGFVFSLHQSFVVAPNVQTITRLLFEGSSIQSHNERTEAFLIFHTTFGCETMQRLRPGNKASLIKMQSSAHRL